MCFYHLWSVFTTHRLSYQLKMWNFFGDILPKERQFYSFEQSVKNSRKQNRKAPVTTLPRTVLVKSRLRLSCHYFHRFVHLNLVSAIFIKFLKLKHFTEKSCRKYAAKDSPIPLYNFLVNNPKQPLHPISYFKSKIFRKRIIKKPEKR